MKQQHFAICDGDGLVLRTGVCPPELARLQALDGERMFRVQANPGDRVVDGAVIPAAPPPAVPPPAVPPPPDYAAARARAYPAVTAQLDALWHAMDAGQLPKAEPFYSQIAAVKAAHPKPQEQA